MVSLIGLLTVLRLARRTRPRQSSSAGCTTAAFLGVAILFAILAIRTHSGEAVLTGLAVALAVAVAIGAWLGQVALVRRQYAGKEESRA